MDFFERKRGEGKDGQTGRKSHGPLTSKRERERGRELDASNGRANQGTWGEKERGGGGGGEGIIINIISQEKKGRQ